MSDKIYLTGVSGIGYHGVFKQEKREGQTFTVDIEVISDFSAAVKSTVKSADVASVIAIFTNPVNCNRVVPIPSSSS